MQKAGFMLVELAFASSAPDRRHVVILVSIPLPLTLKKFYSTFQKHQDAFASAFGFFLIGFDTISGYTSPQAIPQSFFRVTDPMLWFFKVCLFNSTTRHPIDFVYFAFYMEKSLSHCQCLVGKRYDVCFFK